MKAVIKLEMIGDDYFWAKRNRTWSFDQELRYIRRLGPDKTPSWIARLKPGMKREFLRGTRDYSDANSTGSRGIFEYYPLSDGVYEVNDRYELGKVRHYFILVESGEIREITREEAVQWMEASEKSISA